MRKLPVGNVISISKFVWPSEYKQLQDAGESDGLVTFTVAPLEPDMDLGKLVKAVFIDTETTGLGPLAEVIEVAVAPFCFHRDTGALHWVGEPYVGLQEPAGDIPAETTKVHGITMDDVRGKQIDWARVRSMLSTADMVVAHNAKFDRPLVEAALRAAKQPDVETPWACSMAQVEWKTLIGSPSNALEVICRYQGFWYAAHRAEADIGAGIHALSEEGQLSVLYGKLYDKVYEVRAMDAPYAANQAVLKPRKYGWNGDGKYWAMRFKTMDEAQEEVAFLKENVYTPYKLPCRAKVVEMDPSRG